MGILCKVFGAMCLLGSTGYFAWSLNIGIDKRNIQLRRLYSILLQLKSEIQYMNSPLPECFEKLGRTEQEPFSGWLCKMAEKMKQKERIQFASVWQEGTENLCETSALKRQDMEPLLALKDKLGNADVDAQIKAVDYVLLQLETNRKQLEADMKQQKKMSMSISLFVGFLTLILLF